MHRRLACALAVGLGGCAPTPAPLQVFLSFIGPGALGSSLSDPGETKYSPVYGWGNVFEERTLDVHFALQTSDPADDPALALEATELELCWKSASLDDAFCAGGAWLLDKSALSVASIGTADVGSVQYIGRPLPWGSDDEPPLAANFAVAAADAGWFIRSSPAAAPGGLVESDWLAMVQAGGFAQNWEEVAASPHFRVYGVLDHPSTWGGLSNCTQGAKVRWQKDTPLDQVCVDQAAQGQSDLFLEVLELLDETHQSRLAAQSPHVIDAWGNNDGPTKPIYVMVGPRFKQTGMASPGGGIAVTAGFLAGVDPAAPLTGSKIVRGAGHEYFHKFEQWYQRLDADMGGTGAFPSGLPVFSEPFATAVAINQCTFGYPSIPVADCASAGKLGFSLGGGHFDGAEIFKNPTLSLFKPAFDPYNYAMGSFWLYTFEQFSYPLLPKNNAHPSDSAASFERQGVEPIITLLNDSDVGHDLVGRYYDALLTAPDGEDVLDTFDKVAQQRIGRSIPDLAFDYRTAMFLKSYNDAGDERWRLDWVGSFVDPNPIEVQKPFVIPASLYNTEDDLLPRPRRLLEGYGACSPSCVKFAVPDYLEPGELVLSGPNSLEPYHGAGALSVVLPPGYPEPTVHVTCDKGGFDFESGTTPRVRIFRLQRQPPGSAVVPEVVCGALPDLECTWIHKANGWSFVSQDVPVDADTQEVLVVGVAPQSDQPGLLTTRFGPGSAVLDIKEPTATTPAFAGHPSGPDGPRPVLLKLQALTSTNAGPLEPMSYSSLSVELSNGGAPLCTLTGDADPATPDPFVPTPLSGGNTFLLFTPPAACYPFANTRLDLRVRLYDASGVELASAFQPDALLASKLAQPRTTIFALDRGATMVPQKLGALKVVAKAMVDALLPPAGAPTDSAAIVGFNDTATTLLGITPIDAQSAGDLHDAIDGLTAVGGAALGNGLLEAQELLAVAYDALAQKPQQRVMLVSDGLSTADDTISQYLFGPLTVQQPNWSGVPLVRSVRQSPVVNLRVPVISAIALGQDAELFALDQLVKYGAGSLVYAPAGLGLTLPTMELADAMSQALADGQDFDRILSKRTKGLTPAELPALPVEPGATELRVVVVSATQRTQTLRLRAPNGQLVQPLSKRKEATVFRVRNPMPGTWTFAGGGPGTPAPSVFIEASLRSRVKVLTTVDMEHPTTYREDHEGFENEVGNEVVLHAVPMETAGPILGCDVSARITKPSGVVVQLELADDGKHADRTRGDGAYGARFARTGEPGLYEVRFFTTCGALRRESRRSFRVAASLDSDGDGMPDVWEARHGLDAADRDDAEADPDEDGLPNLEELAGGSSPTLSDTDGGGEDDASELAQGRDPNDATDDAVRRPTLSLRPGDGFMSLRFGMRTQTVDVEVQRAGEKSGPWETLAAHAGLGATAYEDRELENGVLVCYRLRASHLDRGRSGWSMPVCRAPAVDPFPPRARIADWVADRELRRVSIELALDDVPNSTDVFPASEVSGVEALQFDTVPGFEHASWVSLGDVGVTRDPETGVELEWDEGLVVAALPAGVDSTTVWVRARDAAGNVGPAAVVAVRLEGAR